MNPGLRGSAAHVVVDDLAAPLLDAADRHHLRSVLRLRPGEAVTATDGQGRWVLCRWNGDGALAVDGPVVDEPRRRPVTVACAIPKGERPEWIVEKLTEIGVDRLVWVETQRSVVRWTAERAARNRQRLAKVARAAAMQSRRTTLLTIDGPMALGDVLASGAVAIADPNGSAWLPADVDTVVIGPEGGFDAAETPPDLPRVALASTILRVETAAFLAGYLLIAR